MTAITQKDRKDVVNRLRRIEGQIRGLEKLVQEEAPCLDILTQVSAVTAAIKKVGTKVVANYIGQCLAEVSGTTPAEQERKMEDFQKALARYIDMA